MAKPWADLEAEVRGIAQTIWRAKFESRIIDGRQIDAYAEPDRFHSIAIEVTQQRSIEKLQEDINKLYHTRAVNFTKNILTECYLVVDYEPTIAMKNDCDGSNVQLYRSSDFRFRFLPFDEYRTQRLQRPFGSAVNPDTGQPDGRPYVVVQFNSDAIRDCNIDKVVTAVDSGASLILTGEYGTGKSKCVERVFEILSGTAWQTYRFPISIDLRRAWGLRDRYEILHRHLHELNMGQHIDSFIKAYNDGYLLLLLDGFDEIGTQAWSDNPATMRAMRADALEGVRDLIANQKGGILVCGREHYFDKEDELVATLGLANKNPISVRTNDEFSYDEIVVFLDQAGYSYEIPEWLPRKPLTCEFFVKLFAEVGIELTEDVLDPISFWDLFLEAVCRRESQIHSSFDSETIKRILIAVSALTRSKSNTVGPLTLTEIQEAFEVVVGYAPIEQAAVLLQRLPGLGRAAADSQDRQFVDTYLLAGLQALDLVSVIETHDTRPIGTEWMNALSEDGLLIAGRKLLSFSLIDEAIGYCKKNCSGKNKTLILDIVASIASAVEGDVDFGAVEIVGGAATTLDFSGVRLANLYISDSVIETLVISGSESDSVRMERSIIGSLEGVSGPVGIPKWLAGNTIGRFTSVATVSRIKNADISAAHKVLVTILRKTFFQKGSARKAEALLRGLGKLVAPGVQDRILTKLIGEDLLDKEKGDTGDLYVPVRANTRRVAKMLAELNLSKDEVWEFVGTL